MTINRQMQKVIKNRGRNLDNMNVYSLFIFITDPIKENNGCKNTKKLLLSRHTAMLFFMFQASGYTPNREL